MEGGYNNKMGYFFQHLFWMYDMQKPTLPRSLSSSVLSVMYVMRSDVA